VVLTFQSCKLQIRHAFKRFSRDKLINNSLRTSWANGVLLVEGATELGAFPVWFPQVEGNAGKTLADLNIALYGMGSKDDLPFYLRFLMAFGIPCAAIGDGDALMPTFMNKRGEIGNNPSFSALWKVLQERCPAITMPQENDPFEVNKHKAAGCMK